MKQPYKNISSLKINNLVLIDPTLIENYVVNHFTNLFSSSSTIHDNDLIKESFNFLLNEKINKPLTLIPSIEEIKKEIFSLNKDTSPSRDG